MHFLEICMFLKIFIAKSSFTAIPILFLHFRLIIGNRKNIGYLGIVIENSFSKYRFPTLVGININLATLNPLSSPYAVCSNVLRTIYLSVLQPFIFLSCYTFCWVSYQGIKKKVKMVLLSTEATLTNREIIGVWSPVYFCQLGQFCMIRIFCTNVLLVFATNDKICLLFFSY